MVKIFDLPPDEIVAGGVDVEYYIRPKLAVNIMRAELPLEIIDKMNQHIDDVLVPAKVNDPIFGSVGKDHNSGLVAHGQPQYSDQRAAGHAPSRKGSAGTTFPHENDEIGEQFGSILLKLAIEYMNHTVGDIKCDADIQTIWALHSYEGDYNPVHDHGTRTPIGLSFILYLKVPPQIEALAACDLGHVAAIATKGAIDGFTYLVWGSNGMRDINILKPITEEYIKPEVGMLIIFPSWLRHGVMPFFGEGERRTMSGNINITHDQKIMPF